MQAVLRPGAHHDAIPAYDLVLKGGVSYVRLEPRRHFRHRGGDGKIAAIEADILRALQIRRGCLGKLVLPGLIDTHAHVFGTSLAVWPGSDMVVWNSGVTTVVDQGGPLLHDIPAIAFHRQRRRPRAATRSCQLMSWGLEGHIIPTYSYRGVDVKATLCAALANKDIVRGIKANAEIGGFARWG